jgi:hypothetical protein
MCQLGSPLGSLPARERILSRSTGEKLYAGPMRDVLLQCPTPSKLQHILTLVFYFVRNPVGSRDEIAVSGVTYKGAPRGATRVNGRAGE